MTETSTAQAAPSPVMTEDQVLEYLDVLERTVETTNRMLPHIEGDDNRQMLIRDAEVLSEIRVKIWRQFQGAFVDVIN